MKIVGTTNATGTCSIVAAINYDPSRRYPSSRINSHGDSIEVDDVLVIGRNSKSGHPDTFHVLAEIHDDNVTPLASLDCPAVINLAPFLSQEITRPGFSAYIERMRF